MPKSKPAEPFTEPLTDTVRSYKRRFYGDGTLETADFANEAYLKLLDSKLAEGFLSNPDGYRALATKIAKEVVLDALRARHAKKRTGTKVEYDDLLDGHGAEGDQLAATMLAEIEARMAQFLAGADIAHGIPKEQRERMTKVFTFKLERYSNQEIASALGIAKTTVHADYHFLCAYLGVKP